MGVPEKVRVGIIGCGQISSLHAAAYLAHPRAELRAICDTDAVLLERRQKEWGVAKAFRDYEELLEDDTIDAVDVLVPHHLHRTVTLAALAAGKHVSLQKPPVFTLDELDEIFDAAQAAGRQLRVFENFMYYPPHQKARKLVAEGAIGEPLSVRIKTAAGRPEDGWAVPQRSQSWRMDPTTCGGGPTCFDHGYHCYNMARFFFREPIERVHAWIHVNRFGDDALYDGPALVTWKYAGVPKYGSWEVIASIGMRVRSRYYASDDRIELHGSEGILWVNRCTGKLLEEPPLVLYRDGETHAFHDLPSDWADSFSLGIADFVDALIEGRQAAQGREEAHATLRFAIAAHLAAYEGREVNLAEVEGHTRPRLRVE
jgi:predicted dehydrogenase